MAEWYHHEMVTRISRATGRPVMESRRRDGRGHWPRGVRLHADVRVRGWGSIPTLMAEVRRLARPHGRKADLARRLRVSRKTLWRWLSGHDWPGATHARNLAAWVRQAR